MHTFTTRGPKPDDPIRTWELAIDVTQIRLVKDLVGVDLHTAMDDGQAGLIALLRDTPRLVDVVFTLVRDQAKEAGVTDQDFGRALRGDTLDAMADAFVAELIDFFPSRVAIPLRHLVEKGKKVAQAMTSQALARLDAIDPEDLAARWIASSTKSPAGSASTPGPSPSAPSS